MHIIKMNEWFRKTHGIGTDAGTYDPIKDIWYMLSDIVYYYCPYMKMSEKRIIDEEET